MFFLPSCLVDKFSPHISGYRLGTYRFIAIKNFLKKVRLKFEFLGVISKGLYENETFQKTYVNGEFDFIKRPERRFFANLHRRRLEANVICMVVWVEKAE